MAAERLQKILARAGVASRRAAEELITAGRVRVNGRVVDELGARADAHKDKVELDGKRVVLERPVYYLLHKPRGYVTTLASAIEPPCALGFRRRVLERVDDTTIRIDETLQREVDMSLSGDACSIEEASARRDAMPCVEQSVWTAELRSP